MDPEKRRRAAEKQVVRRRLDKLKQAKNIAELEAMFEADYQADVAAGQTHHLFPKKDEQEGEPAPESAAPTPPPLASKDCAELLWKSIGQVFLKGTRYELNEAKLDVLVEGTVPILDKYLPTIADGPEAKFAVALAVVFGPALTSHAMEALKPAPKPVVEGLEAA